MKEPSVTGRKTFSDDVLNYKSQACPNPVHPKGRWHEASPLPPSWDFVERASQWFNRARWGCSCHAVPNIPSSEYWKVAASFFVLITAWAMIVFVGLSYDVSMDDVAYWRGTAVYNQINRGGENVKARNR